MKASEKLESKQVKAILEKLDSVRLEILRLRAQLLPEEAITEEERKEILAARREVADGKSSSLKDLLKEIGE